MAKQLTFWTLTELIEPEGCPGWGWELWGVSEEYDARLMQASNGFAKLLNERLSGDYDPIPHGLCVPALVREYTALIDHHALPSSTAELAYSSYVMGRGIHHALMIVTAQQRVQALPASVFNLNRNTATA